MTIYSHSRLESFKSCPLKYKFNYIDKIKMRRRGSFQDLTPQSFYE